jgi:hypothetical protein
MKKKILLIASITSFIVLCSVYPAIGNTQELDMDVSYYGPNYDINHDGLGNALDVSSLVSSYGDSGDPNHFTFREDINRDGVVNALDVSGLVSNYGSKWTTS